MQKTSNKEQETTMIDLNAGAMQARERFQVEYTPIYGQDNAHTVYDSRTGKFTGGTWLTRRDAFLHRAELVNEAGRRWAGFKATIEGTN
jgi:hypothetical protein